MGEIIKQKHRSEGNTILYLCITAVAIGIQLLHKYGTLENLMFMLQPVTFIVERALATAFYYQQDLGFLSEKGNIIINKTCAGTTFWTMAFCMLSFTFISSKKGVLKKLTWVFAFFLFSYTLTIIANVSRIIIAIGILDLKISENVSVERLLHQSVGVLVYCTYLWTTYLIFSKLIRKEENHEKTL